MNKIKNLTIIDDDDLYVMLIKMNIELTKLVEKTEVFVNGLEAINFLKENANNINELPDIILLDINMPIMHGWQFLSEYIKLNPLARKKITIYVCSSSISPDDIARAKSISEVSDYIIKPVSKEKLTNLLLTL